MISLDLTKSSEVRIAGDQPNCQYVSPLKFEFWNLDSAKKGY